MSIDWGHGLEDRVTQLETWSGPGQIEALIEGQRAIRADLTKLQVTVDRHGRQLTRLTRDVSGLKTDVATLKTEVDGLKEDMVEVKGTLKEILRRLPEPSSAN